MALPVAQRKLHDFLEQNEVDPSLILLEGLNPYGYKKMPQASPRLKDPVTGRSAFEWATWPEGVDRGELERLIADYYVEADQLEAAREYSELTARFCPTCGRSNEER